MVGTGAAIALSNIVIPSWCDHWFAMTANLMAMASPVVLASISFFTVKPLSFAL